MANFIYTFEKYNGIKSRHNCPACGYKHEFARYVDQDGNYISEDVGRCNRESKCGYHLTPKQYFESNGIVNPPLRTATVKAEVRKQIEYVSPDVLKSTLKAYDKNTFVQYLNTIFDSETVSRLIDMYGLGTTKNESCIFWQVDNKGLVRTGKIIKYDATGHRDKTIPPYFIHSKLNIENIEQCLFGLHLIVNDLPIGLVESEKTAVIMAGKLPEYSWMATGGKTSGLTSKVAALKGKKVVCFPDSDAFADWNDRLSSLGFKISDALNKYLTPEEQSEGLDLADFVTKAQSYFETLKDGRVIEMHNSGFPADWDRKHPNFKTMVERFDLIAV